MAIKILKHGIGKGNLKSLRKFQCQSCGCIWTADRADCEEDWNRPSIPCICNCPECKEKTYELGPKGLGEIKIEDY